MQACQEDSVGPSIDQIASPAPGRLSKWMQYLQEPIDGASLAVFRICFGLLMIVNLAEYYPALQAYYIAPKFNFSFIPGLHPWPGNGMYEHFAVMASAALCIAVGAWCRPACLVFCLGQTYLLLLDKAYYQNHLYLICLLAFLLALTPSNRVWSFDNLQGQMPPMVPRWSVQILKAQIFIVYFYGAIAKLNSDWFHGEPLATNLHAIPATAYYGLGAIANQQWFSQLVTWGGIAVDFSIGFLLWCPQTFWVGALVGLVFHSFNSILFPIGIFPWLMIATIGIFASPDWPRRIFKKFKRKGSDLFATTGDAAGSVKTTTSTLENELERPGGVTQTGTRHQHWTSTGIIVFLHIYFVVQILLPLRHFLYPGDPAWTEEGHRFAWRMMLRTKTPTVFEFLVTNPGTQKTLKIAARSTWIDNGSGSPWMDKALNIIQQFHMVRNPDMILQCAHFIADTFEAQWHVRPVVRVRAIERLNHRHAAQFLIDPEVDLAAQTQSWLRPSAWIVPLQPEETTPQADSPPAINGSAAGLLGQFADQ